MLDRFYKEEWKLDKLLKDKKALKLFFLLTIPVSVIIEGLYIICKNPTMILILMWTPGIAGIITSHVYYRKENALGIRMGKLRYILIGIFIPIVYLALSYDVTWLVLKDSTIGITELAQAMGYHIDMRISQVTYIIIFLVVGLFSSCLSAAGEELGWRGFMYPVMERVIGRKKALISGGFIWACWHMPLIITGLYQSKTVLWYGLLMFTVVVVFMSIIMAWLRISSNSVMPALFVHASHNLFDQNLFQPMSTNKYVPYYAGEQGFITMLFLAVFVGIAIYCWKREESKEA